MKRVQAYSDLVGLTSAQTMPLKNNTRNLKEGAGVG